MTNDATPDRLAADLASAASRLALATDPAEDTARTLYAIATAIGSLRSPVGRLGNPHRTETQDALKGLRDAELALHALQRAITSPPG